MPNPPQADTASGPPEVPDSTLVSALSDLQNLLLHGPEVVDFLQQVSELAASVVQATACGITIRRDHELLTLGGSNFLAGQVDELQYRHGQGPCLQALQTATIVRVSDYGADDRWPDYPQKALALGVLSSLSLPLSVDGTAFGALNLYADQVAHFGESETHLAQIFARHAATALVLVLRHAQQHDLETQLREAVAVRTVVDQALGITMGQERCTAADAFAILREASQHQNRKLRDVAAEMIEAVTGQPPQEGRPFIERPSRYLASR